MTTAVHPAVVKMTRDEARILAHYAAGESAKEIAANIRMDLGVVGLALDSLCGNNRNLANNLAVEWQKRARAVAASRPASGPDRTPPSISLPSPKTPAPAVEAPAEPKVWQLQVDDIAALLDACEASGAGKLHRAAKKIRDLLAELQEQFGEHSRGAKLRQEQADLEARLAQIREQLRGSRGPHSTPARSAAPTGGAISPREVRAWATANGIECNTHGRVPAQVVEAYQQAVAR